jgi:hypothetical protein
VSLKFQKEMSMEAGVFLDVTSCILVGVRCHYLEGGGGKV